MPAFAYDMALTVVFSLWLALTIGKQFRDPIFRRLGRLDSFNLLPIWTFFAPNPGKTDLHILFRDTLQDGSLTGWQEILHRHKRQVRLLWNPAKRRDKILRDCVQVLRRSERELSARQALCFTVPYLMILSHVVRASVPHHSIARQFLIVEEGCYPGGETLPVFMSSFHLVKTSNGS